MKKTGRILIALFGTIMITSAFIIPDSTPPNDPPTIIPDSVWAIFEISCYDCHSNNGNGLVKAKLNFDKWNIYSPEKQLKKATNICQAMQDQKMPPSKYLKKNPDDAPSVAEVIRVCNWLGEIAK